MISGVFVASLKDFKVWHRPQIECLAAAGADFVAFETIPSLKEAKALVDLLREFPDVKAWLSFSCKVNTVCVMEIMQCFQCLLIVMYLPKDCRWK